jgi:hypothetical protein
MPRTHVFTDELSPSELEVLVAENEAMRCELIALRVLKAALQDDERRAKAKLMLLQDTLDHFE